MTTFKINVAVATPAEITKGLCPDDDVALKLARETAVNARRELEHATRRLSDAGAIVSSTKTAVADGRAAPADLERALRAQTVAALVLPQHQARVVDAEKAIVVALQHAKQAVVAEANRRGATLQVEADKIRPILEALKLGEGALDALVTQVRGEPSCVTAVVWPNCLEADAVQSHGRDLSRQVNIRVNPVYPVRPVNVPSQ